MDKEFLRIYRCEDIKIEFKKMKILIVGGAGYVGGAVTDLLKNKYDITVFDNLLYENSFQKNVKFIYGDVRDYKLLKKLFSRFDAIVWIAAIVGDGACNINPSVTNEVNFNSVKFLSKNFKGRIIFFSTCSVYGAQNGILNEKSKINPLSMYAITKLKAENILKNNNSIIFRLGTLFGIGDDYSRVRMDLVLNILTAKAYFEKKISVFGGNQYRPLLHVKDAAKAIELALESKNNGIYNIHKENITILNIAKKIKNKFKKIQVNKVKIKFQDARNYKVTSDKAKNDLNFNPLLSIEYGIDEIYHLISSKRIKNINDPRYTNQKFLEMYSNKLNSI
jgi:nucleoside-diphosphate-sugar epimerase